MFRRQLNNTMLSNRPTGFNQSTGFTGCIRMLGKDLKKNKTVYFMILPVVAYFIIFCYGPMYGLQIAFKYYTPGKGFLNSPWVGLKNFEDFLTGFYFVRVLRNTIVLNALSMLFEFPAPIILALLLNELRSVRYRRIVQTVSYFPYFISLVVIAGLIKDFTVSDGLINDIIAWLGGQRISMLQQAGMFRTIFIASDIWQGVGWGSIIYFAAISSIDQELYQAAIVDGAGRFRQIWHITLPGITPTIVILFILSMGSMLSVSSEKVILLYNPATYETADVISSYVYRQGIQQLNFSYSAAVGLLNSVVSLLLLVISNAVSRRFGDTSLW